MRRMLDPKEVGGGGLPSTITFDKDGNRKVSKDLGVDGKLKLTSLVNNTNKDGDITKELAKKIYSHCITATDDSKGTVVFTIYSSIEYEVDFSKVPYILENKGGATATGIVNINGSNKMITSVYVNSYRRVVATWIDESDRTTGELAIDNFKTKDKVSLVR